MSMADVSIDDFIMHCGKCKNITINSGISNSASINCRHTDECFGAAVTFTSLTANVNYKLNCSSNSGSCRYSTFTFNGYINSITNDNQTNNLSVICDTDFACSKANLYGNNLNHVDINCYAPC